MKNHQKGFVVPLLIVLAVLVIVGGIAYFAVHKGNSPAAQEDQSVTQASSTSSLAQGQNCGTIVISPIAKNGDLSKNLAEGQKNIDSYACMSKATLTCAPATLSIPASPSLYNSSSTQTYNQTFNILPKRGQICPIEKVDNTTHYQMTCSIPMGVIATLQDGLKSQNLTGYLFKYLQFVFVPAGTPAGQKAQIQQAGQPVHIQCTDKTGVTWLAS